MLLPGYPARLDSLATKGLAAYLIAKSRPKRSPPVVGPEGPVTVTREDTDIRFPIGLR